MNTTMKITKRGLIVELVLVCVMMGMSAVSLFAQKTADHKGSSAVAHEHGAAATSKTEDEIGVFCPTMKTGQLCSRGTANIFQFKDDKAEQWMKLSRKYNKAVDAATLQLFKDAESVLTPDQLKQLKAWFAVGLNPEINQLLYSKGLEPAPTAKHEH